MAPCRPFLFISFPRGFRLSSSNLGFFGCGVQLVPHSRSFPNSLRFPSLVIPFFGSGRPSGAGSPSSIALQQELNECMNGFSHKPARVVRRAYLASTRQHQQENENPARRQSQREGVPFVSVPVELRDHQLAQGREPRPDRAIEKSLLRSRLPSCREAFSVLLSKGAAGRKLPARPTKSFSGGRWRALAKGTAWAA